MKKHGLLKTIISLITAFCFLVTIVAGVFYYSFSTEINKMLEVGLLVKTQYLHDVTFSQMITGAVKGMVQSLEDPYSVYLEGEEYEELQRYIQGSIGGIGVYVGVKDGKLVVVSPIEGTPAYEAGLKREDVIVKVDDTFTSELEYDETVARMRGEPGTPVSIGVTREGVAEILTFEITRKVIEIPSVESELTEKNIGYMRILTFASNTDEAVKEQLLELLEDGAKALVLDLRDNPGGDLSSAVNIAKLFVPEGPIVFTVDKRGEMVAYNNEESVSLNIPLVVLVNGGSASASEVLAGAIKDTESGVLLGERTFGKGIVQGIFMINEEDGLKLTTSKYLTPNKTDIHELGIEPDIFIELTAADEEDVQLKGALEYLEEQMD